MVRVSAVIDKGLISDMLTIGSRHDNNKLLDMLTRKHNDLGMGSTLDYLLKNACDSLEVSV